MDLAALHARRAPLPRRRLPRVHQRAAGHEGRLALDDDEDVIRLLVYFDFTRTASLRQHDEAVIPDDLPALRHRRRHLLVRYIGDDRRRSEERRVGKECRYRWSSDP